MQRLQPMALLELTKPRVSSLAVMTTVAGFYLASEGTIDVPRLLHVCIGALLAAGGTAVLNQVMERGADAQMRRTANRPLPSGRVDFPVAATLGIVLITAGSLYLLLLVNPASAVLALLTASLYLLLYTPLKSKTTLCTTIGAVPGAIPPLIGWVGAGRSLDLEAAVLFGILFLWQFPHFLSIAWVYKEDYRRGGFQMLPLADEDGQKTANRILIFNLALLVGSLLPTWLDSAGLIYLGSAVLLGIYFLNSAWHLRMKRDRAAAHGLLKASVLYLPLLLVMMVLDKQ